MIQRGRHRRRAAPSNETVTGEDDVSLTVFIQQDGANHVHQVTGTGDCASIKASSSDLRQQANRCVRYSYLRADNGIIHSRAHCVSQVGRDQTFHFRRGIQQSRAADFSDDATSLRLGANGVEGSAGVAQVGITGNPSRLERINHARDLHFRSARGLVVHDASTAGNGLLEQCARGRRKQIDGGTR